MSRRRRIGTTTTHENPWDYNKTRAMAADSCCRARAFCRKMQLCHENRAPVHLIAIALGMVVGVLVGFLGVGGGVVLVPVMVYLLHFDQHTAQGTSLLMQLPPLGIGALLVYWKRREVDLMAGILCALGFLLGGYFGSALAIGIASRQLRAYFAVFQMIAAVLLWRRKHKPAPATLGASDAP